MDNLYLKETEETPWIIFDKDKSIFKMGGKSYMEDAASFYEPVIKWLKAYVQSPVSFTRFVFEMEYVNTASSKVVNDILDVLEDLYLESNGLEVEWRYFEEDEDMEEMGEEYKEIYDMPFVFKQIDNQKPDHLFEIE